MNPTMNKQQAPKTQAETIKVDDGVIDNYHALDAAMLNVQRGESKEYLEVTPDFFAALTKGTKTNYLTYGSPGIKVYVQGSKGDIDREESMTCEQKHAFEIARAKTTGKKF